MLPWYKGDGTYVILQVYIELHEHVCSLKKEDVGYAGSFQGKARVGCWLEMQGGGERGRINHGKRR